MAAPTRRGTGRVPACARLATALAVVLVMACAGGEPQEDAPPAAPGAAAPGAEDAVADSVWAAEEAALFERRQAAMADREACLAQARGLPEGAERARVEAACATRPVVR